MNPEAAIYLNKAQALVYEFKKLLDEKEIDHNKIERVKVEYDDALTFIRLEAKTMSKEQKDQAKQIKRAFKTCLHDYELDVRKEIIGDGNGDGNGNVQICIDDTPEGIIQYAKNLQNKDIDGVRRTIGVIGDAKEIGIQTAAKIQAQTEQIAKMKDDLAAIESELTRAGRHASIMIRKTMNSKVVWVLTGLIVVCIAIIIIMKTT
jgi:hypothetical protein